MEVIDITIKTLHSGVNYINEGQFLNRKVELCSFTVVWCLCVSLLFEITLDSISHLTKEIFINHLVPTWPHFESACLLAGFFLVNAGVNVQQIRCMCMFHRNGLLTFTDKTKHTPIRSACSRTLTAQRSVATWTGHSDAPARHLLQRNPSHPKLPYSRRPVPLFLHISGLNYWTEVEELKLILWAEFQYELKFIYLPVKKRCVVCVLCLLYCFICL